MPALTQQKEALQGLKSSLLSALTNPCEPTMAANPLVKLRWKTRMHLHHHRHHHIDSIRALSVGASPLHWWRTKRPRNLRRSDVRILRARLFRTETVADLDWFRAATGDAAAAIGVAIRAMHTAGMTNSAVDAALSAVLCCALEGDPTAPVVICSALNRRRRFDPRCAELCRIWQRTALTSA